MKKRGWSSISGPIVYEYSNTGCTTGWSGGSVDRVIKETTPLGVISYTYDAIGNVTTSGEPNDNPFQYTSRENDGTGLYYYRARYYSPHLQRFLGHDPIRSCLKVNSYVYGKNDPLKYTDPKGTSECSDRFWECAEHTAIKDLECIKNVALYSTILAMSCPIICVAATPPLYLECLGICLGAVGAGGAFALDFCHAYWLVELAGSCGIDYYNCTRQEKEKGCAK